MPLLPFFRALLLTVASAEPKIPKCLVLPLRQDKHTETQETAHEETIS